MVREGSARSYNSSPTTPVLESTNPKGVDEGNYMDYLVDLNDGRPVPGDLVAPQYRYADIQPLLPMDGSEIEQLFHLAFGTDVAAEWHVVSAFIGLIGGKGLPL